MNDIRLKFYLGRTGVESVKFYCWFWWQQSYLDIWRRRQFVGQIWSNFPKDWIVIYWREDHRLLTNYCYNLQLVIIFFPTLGIIHSTSHWDWESAFESLTREVWPSLKRIICTNQNLSNFYNFWMFLFSNLSFGSSIDSSTALFAGFLSKF